MITVKYFKKFTKTRKITVTKEEMISFETSIATDYEKGKIKGPIHLSKGNEEQLIDIFSRISKNDWVFSSWRNHYHALLHGVDSNLIKKFIYSGKSMSVSSKKPKFFSSSIVA
jgi:TPP-dependent pyruvate/acetoin dehydrogenase alpha subunit